jgi:hypothetical protein
MPGSRRSSGRADWARDSATSVDGEWSFVQTLRHLVFATDKWFTVPIVGGTFHPIGISNSGSADFGWPGIDTTAAPTFDEAVAAWQDRSRQLRRYIDGVEPAALIATVDVLENGTTPVLDCIGVVFEEHLQRGVVGQLEVAEVGPCVVGRRVEGRCPTRCTS